MSDAAAIQFFFDFSSPYAYLGADKVGAFAEKHGRSVDWRPIMLGPILKQTGNAPNASIELKGDYTRADCERLARFAGLPMSWPETFPISTLGAARAFYWLKETDPARAVPFAMACFRRYFGDGVDISADGEVSGIADALGIDTAALHEAVARPDVKERLKAETQAAIDAGVFGSPFFLVDGEPFWGADRFWLIDRYLKAGSRWPGD